MMPEDPKAIPSFTDVRNKNVKTIDVKETSEHFIYSIGQYKVEIYDRYTMSCLSFDFTVCDLSKSVLDSLDCLVRKYSRIYLGRHLE